MRIAIDATPLLLRSAGVKNFLYYWILHLRRLAGVEAILTFPFASRIGALDHERSVVGRWPTLTGLGWLHLANYSGLPILNRIGRRVDVFHASQQLHNPPRNCRLTATIHDMTCWLMPALHTRANVAAARKFATAVLTRADGLIAVSENSRRDAVGMLGLPPERIEVIYQGVDEAFFAVAPEAVPAVRARYSLGRPYLLFVGTVEPRKNLATLLEAYQALAPSLRGEFELVVAGPAGWGERRLVERLRAGGGGLRYLGYVPEPDLPGLTAGATLFIYPSLYEGFGLPVAQAMAAGVPVVTSRASSLPEITDGAAVLVDPRSPAELCAALERLLPAPGERTELARRGRAVAQRYHWEACAGRSLEFFRRVCGRDAA